MTKMKRCPCCGTNSSAGHKAHTKYYSLLERYSELAEIHGNQVGLLDATNEYLSNITLGVSSSARPNKIPYEGDLYDLAEAHRLLGLALDLEEKQ